MKTSFDPGKITFLTYIFFAVSHFKSFHPEKFKVLEADIEKQKNEKKQQLESGSDTGLTTPRPLQRTPAGTSNISAFFRKDAGTKYR